MTKVLSADLASVNSYVELDVSAFSHPFYIQFQFALLTSTASALTGGAATRTAWLFELLDTGGLDTSTGFISNGPTWDTWDDGGGDFVSGFSLNTWSTVLIEWDGTTITANADGTFWYSYAPGHTKDKFRLGGLNAAAYVAGEVYYFSDVRIGSTPGGSNLFADDFSGTLSGWTSTHGSVSIVDDPIIPVPPTEGIVIAFADDALAPTPTWTRIDNIKGVNTASVQIKRGRPDARSKSSVGTGTISGYDMIGDTDPTNTGGPFFGELEPTKQAQILLFNPVASTWAPIYTGFTSDWTHVLDVSEKKLDFTLDLVDMLDMFNDAEVAPDQAGNTVPGESKGDVYYTGQHVDDRLLAVLADAGTDFPAGIFQPTWPNSASEGAGGEIASGNVFVQGRVYANRTTLLQIIDEACDAEGPGATNRFITKDGFFAFRGRYYRYTPGHFIPADGIRVSGQRMLHWFVGDIPAWQLDDSLAVYTGLTFTRGKTNLINASLVTPLGIADTQITDQFVADPISVGLYGPRTEGTSYENIITSTADDGNDPFEETATFGLATIANYHNPVTRVSQIVFRNPPAAAEPARAAATWSLLCNIELSDLITITSTHPGGGGFNQADHFVEGITYDIKPLRGDTWDVTLTLDLSPVDYFASMPNTWQPSETGLLAEFTTSPSPPAGAHPLSVTFTDDSSAGPSGPIVSRHWDFGDGNTSSSTSPTHSFAAAGGYLVNLTITGTGSDGTSSACCYVRAT